MLKNGVHSLLIVLLMSIMMVGCVSQKDYDAVVKERDDAKTQASSFQTDFKKVKFDYDNLKANSDTYKSTIKTISTRLSNETKALAAFNYLIISGNLLASTIIVRGDGSFGTTVTGSDMAKLATASKNILDLNQSIKDIGNSELVQQWTEAMNAGLRQDTEAYVKLLAVLDLLTKLTNDDIKALETAAK